MKKIIGILLLLIASVSHISCEKSEQPDVEGILPVEVSKEISDYFNENLISAFNSVCPEINTNQACMMVIKDAEELAKIFSPMQVPEIDFEKYTFVGCLFHASSPRYNFRKQALEEGPEKITLNILLEEIKGVYETSSQKYYFWGLYNKIPDKPVTAEITVF